MWEGRQVARWVRWLPNPCLGRLLTGDCQKNIHLWTPTDGGSWHVDQRPFVGHTRSVEDLQWSPTEDTVRKDCRPAHMGLMRTGLELEPWLGRSGAQVGVDSNKGTIMIV